MACRRGWSGAGGDNDARQQVASRRPARSSFPTIRRRRRRFKSRPRNHLSHVLVQQTTKGTPKHHRFKSHLYRRDRCSRSASLELGAVLAEWAVVRPKVGPQPTPAVSGVPNSLTFWVGRLLGLSEQSVPLLSGTRFRYRLVNQRSDLVWRRRD